MSAAACATTGRTALVALSTMFSAALLPLHAQSTVNPDCTVTPSTFGSAIDICRKAADLFAFVVPQSGVALAGGNPVLGEGGTLGGWGRRTFTLRATAVDGRAPRNNVPLTLTRSSPEADDFGADRTPVPMASLDAAIGLFAGVPLGVTNVGGVDALLGVTAVPTISAGEFQLRPQGSSVALSYGVRVGLIQESAFVPGLSLSWLRRRMPTLDLDYTPSNDTLQARNIALTANTFRLVASKRFAAIGFAAGVGRDEITGTTGLRAIVNEPVAGGSGRAEIGFPALRESPKRTTAFVNASLGVPIARIVLELGRSRAGTLRETLNTFGDRRANEGYTYGSLGVTVRF